MIFDCGLRIADWGLTILRPLRKHHGGANPAVINRYPCGRMRPERAKRVEGFTLIEVMAAVAIMAIGMLLVLQQRNQAVAKAADIRENRLAALALGDKVSDIVLDKQRTTGNKGGDFEDEAFGGFQWESEIDEEPWDFTERGKQQIPPVKVHRVSVRVFRADDPSKRWEIVTYLPEPDKGAQSGQ